MKTLNEIKKYIDDKYREVLADSKVDSDGLKVISEIYDEVRQIKQKNTECEWVDIKDEIPKNEGRYVVMTDDDLAYGIGYCWEKNGEMFFDLLISTTSAKKPKIKYWLNDDLNGMLKDFKKAKK